MKEILRKIQKNNFNLMLIFKMLTNKIFFELKVKFSSSEEKINQKTLKKTKSIFF